MRLVLVHGREQGRWKDNVDGLRTEWLNALAAGLTAANMPALSDKVEAVMPFYGARLDELTEAHRSLEGVPRGASAPGEEFISEEILLSVAHRAGFTDSDIQAEIGNPNIPRGPQHWQWVRAAVRLLSQKFPNFGESMMREFTADVNFYLQLPDVRDEINGLLVEAIGTEPAVVVGHSLGSIVAYWTLTQRKDLPEVPLFVTLGSPLGIDVVKRHLPRPLGRPLVVRRWLNAADERDPVALYPRLDRDIFPGPDENLSDVHNDRSDPHSIVGYLSDPVVAARIAEALRGID